jgi:hypothetical protein
MAYQSPDEVCILTRNYPRNPLSQPIKGIFIFHQEVDEFAVKAQELMKTLRCEVMTSYENRITVKTSRGNLQSIKQSWLDNDDANVLSKTLNASVSQIIIGGNAS